jgi:hypothetical protein
MKEGNPRSHLPSPEEFNAAFGVGSDPSSLSAIDLCGVILASLKALHRRSTGRETELKALRLDLKEVRGLLVNLEERSSAGERGR